MGNKFKYLPYILATLGIFLVIGLLSADKQNDMAPFRGKEKKVKNITLDNDSFSPDGLKKELNKIGIKHSNIVYAQARLETGNFKSKYFLERNNLFGFRNKTGYMKFNNWKDCCYYYKEWQSKRYEKGDYYQFLLNIRYAEDSMYIEKLKLCIK